MLRKILIANRGEIACRIIRTCREMGFLTVAVYSDADATALHVELADEAVHLGESAASESYLNMQKIIAAARRSGAEAIHPGYGFLAENAQFAYMVRAADLIFIGPSAEAIEAMGDKRMAKIILENVPFVPGYIGEDQSNATLIHEAQRIGLPVMIKAAAGGGGKGMRQVSDIAELPAAIDAARREALQAFGNGTLMLERAIRKPRHIEVQIFGDHYGQIIALGERECSIQRRHQKIIEESPSSILTQQQRHDICRTAINIGRQLGYSNAGTVEFLLDEDGQFYFMEMNTRLQVEHPVTEMTYAVDLVRWQIEAALGTPLDELLPPFTDPEIFIFQPDGHAIEARVYAEDPTRHFLPVTGRIIHWQAPSQARCDAGLRSGDSITPYYDPLIAKVIAHGATREEAIRRLDYALAEMQLLGIRNNIAFLRRVLTHPDHLSADISTRFLDERPQLMRESSTVPPFAWLAASISRHHKSPSWRNNAHRPVQDAFQDEAGTTRSVQLSPLAPKHYHMQIDDQAYEVIFQALGGQAFALTLDGHRQTVHIISHEADCWIHSLEGSYRLQWQDPLPRPQVSKDVQGSLRAPMPGQVIAVQVETGQQVTAGTTLMILEAMKMEHRIEAPYDGQVEFIRFAVGDSVQADEILLGLKEEAE